MKNKLIIALTTTFMVMLMVGFAVNQGSPQIALADETSSENTVVVTGSGTIEVEPDMATINIGVQSQNEDAQKAQQENASLMEKVVNAIKAQGIDEKNIITSQYNIYKTSNYLDGDQREEYYVVNNTVNITIDDIDKVGKIIDVASENGANSINNIAFSISDDAAYYQEALKVAMENAEGKATAIMSTFDKQPGMPLNVVENSTGGSLVVYSESAKAYAMDAVSTPIESGQISVEAMVTVTYDY